MVGRRDAPPVGRPYQVPGCTDPVPFVSVERGFGGFGAVSRRLGPVSRLLAAQLLLVALVTVACAAPPAASFDPSGPCAGDGSAPGAYPELEAMVPAIYEDAPPETLDSGRHCTAESLGSLRRAGIDEVRFAGGTWGFGGIRAAALAVFSAPGLTADAMADFYATSARAANRTLVTAETESTLAGRPVHRIDTETGPRQQTVVVWPGAEADVVNVVITNDLPDPKIEAAIEAFGGP